MQEYRAVEFKHLRRTANFGAAELDSLAEVFRGADYDSSGSMDIKEILVLMDNTVVGERLETDEGMAHFVKLFSRLDVDRSLTLDFVEFIRLLRVWTGSSHGACTLFSCPRKKVETAGGRGVP